MRVTYLNYVFIFLFLSGVLMLFDFSLPVILNMKAGDEACLSIVYHRKAIDIEAGCCVPNQRTLLLHFAEISFCIFVKLRFRFLNIVGKVNARLHYMSK